MKFGFITVCLFIAGFSTSVIAATTLKLDQKIDLLMVDGQKMSGSLLKGADSLELGSGQHQILFKVVDTVDAQTGAPVTYFPSTFIATFNTAKVASVSFKLPPLHTLEDRKNFTAQPQYQLLDEKNQAIPVRTDALVIADNELLDIERKMSEYNAAAKGASVAGFSAALNESVTW
ncbi:DUF2057 family protein [Pectobacterium aroidearum]|jgi:uncharacterized protein YccT (UPF0319 family)|uniref:DUF2057 family protein n=1 Tax=Pectobacterium aroidearum TaxID=1201031 RepID=A0ABR5ZAF1_9GAMM|nr:MULTISPECIES: DUF2057 family protein [Pectobacterium]MBA0204504.1 DUF2057 family protein [Pectobacterium aroidearum]MBA5198769.1 DUF2057 family protein [Pectobacterium aroidearum]MBA5226728.1 DUF2057 family protein [Pectobacterium aroidearum]MBA5231561.1 DUF2057 family protein [Pectobacterium aroidearum]MBA5601168.1 DUF2057 family protein [Pectobacterium aroidearum]